MISTMARQVFAVSRITFSELLREKILWSAGLFSILCVGLAYAVSQLSFSDNARIALNFGLTSVSIIGGLISILMGAVLIAKEIQGRTLYLVLTKSIWRWQFLVGRFLGLVGILFCNTILMTAVFVLIYLFLGGSFSSTILQSLILQFSEFFILAAIACIFSSFSTSTLSVISTSGIWILGHAMVDLKILADKVEPVWMRPVLKAVTLVLPDLTVFDIKAQATHGLKFEWLSTLQYFSYSISYMVFALVVASAVFYRKDL